MRREGRMRAWYVMSILAAFCGLASADDLPPKQLLCNTKEVSSMMVSCTNTSPTQADYDCVQLSDRKNKTKEDFKKRFAQIPGLMKEPMKKEDCDAFSSVVDSIRSGKAVGGAKPEMLALFLKDKD